MPVDLIIPALNEAPAIAQVVRSLPRPLVRTVIVVDNGSTDGTGEVARAAGATVVREPRRGYGRACMAGIAALPADADIVVFLDGDGSDQPDDIKRLIAPIEAGAADLVVGSRAHSNVEAGSLTLPQKIGNRIAAKWLQLRFDQRATDLGPLRALRKQSLDRLEMSDPDYGWTVQMQIAAARKGLRYAEVPVAYRRRIGKSKVSGTVRGTVGAAIKILGLLALHDLRGQRPHAPR